PWRYQMKLIHKTAIAAALSSFAMGASAMDQIQDTDLSQVTGQDGVSIGAYLNVSVGSFVYQTNNAAGAGSIGFNNISFTGDFAFTLDILSQTNFIGADSTGVGGVVSTVLGVYSPTAAAGNAVTAFQAGGGTAGGTVAVATAAAAAQANALTNFYNGGDVVAIAIPDIKTSHLLNMSVGSITMGVNGVQGGTNLYGGTQTQSFGSIAMNSINLGGTSVYIWAH
ncbi:MAG: DUF6160 family protein, partial [Burkholderiales bacterium]